MTTSALSLTHEAKEVAAPFPCGNGNGVSAGPAKRKKMTVDDLFSEEEQQKMLSLKQEYEMSQQEEDEEYNGDDLFQDGERTPLREGEEESGEEDRWFEETQELQEMSQEAWDYVQQKSAADYSQELADHPKQHSERDRPNDEAAKEEKEFLIIVSATQPVHSLIKRMEKSREKKAVRFAAEVSYSLVDGKEEGENSILRAERHFMPLDGEKASLVLSKSYLKGVVLLDSEKVLRRKISSEGGLAIRLSGLTRFGLVNREGADGKIKKVVAEVPVEHPLVAVEDAIRAIFPISLSHEEVAEMWSKVEEEFEPKFQVLSLSERVFVWAIFAEEISRLAAFLRIRSSERTKVIERSRIVQNGILKACSPAAKENGSEEKPIRPLDQKVEEKPIRPLDEKAEEKPIRPLDEKAEEKPIRPLVEKAEEKPVRTLDEKVEEKREKKKWRMVLVSEEETETAPLLIQEGTVVGCEKGVSAEKEYDSYASVEKALPPQDIAQPDASSFKLACKVDLLKTMIQANRDIEFIRSVMSLV